MMDNGIPSLSSDSAMTSKEKKNHRATVKIQIKIHFLSLKEKYDTLFKIGSKRPAFEIKPLRSMLNLVIHRISLRKLYYKMERADLPDDYNFFEIRCCGHHDLPYAHIQVKQATKLILSQFQFQ